MSFTPFYRFAIGVSLLCVIIQSPYQSQLPMITLDLIRHAESEMNNKEHLISGRSNQTPLSPLGKEQAQRLGKRLSDEGVFFDEVHVSPAVRTVSTAKIVTEFVGFPWERVRIDDALLELHQGEWEGKLREATYTPETLAVINADCWNFTAPEGESQRTVEERMHRWITKEILEKAKGDYRVAVFGHGVAIKCFLRGILNSSPSMTWKIALGNTSITSFKYDCNGWHLLSVNDMAHLRETKVSTKQ